jgi:HD-GYP domain-containing protein (c-di-GMP phosphodiesterase class II)
VESPQVSRVELLAVLSLVSDLGMGQPMRHAVRQCLIALRLGDEIGLSADERASLVCAGLLAWVGCHVDAYEQAKWFGDDRVMKAEFRQVDFSGPTADLGFMLSHLGSGMAPAARVRATVGFFAGGFKDGPAMLANHAAAADNLAAGLGLSSHARKSIEQTFERWDGRGAPHGATGADILVTSRLVNLADVVEIFHAAGGPAAAVAVARERRGTQFDPTLVDLLTEHSSMVLADLDETPDWHAVVAAEPSLAQQLPEGDLDRALEAIADFVDVKSPYTLGHSRAVADLAREAATTTGLPASDAENVRRAGLLHDLGRMGVSNAIWDKPGPLSVAEMERIRLHPYLTGRTLGSCPGLAPLGELAALHHERLDGTGYPRGLRRDGIPLTAQILGAADSYQAKLEPRPHRPPMPRAQAAGGLRAEVRAGRFDGQVVEAVLTAAGHRPARRTSGQGALRGLTPREVEVLRLLARGRSTKQIASALGISRKTAANHVEHIYAKLGVTNRAMASLFAAGHGLIGADGVEQDDQSAGLP